MKIEAIGVDVGKTVFHLATLDEHGKVVVKKGLSRTQLLVYSANLTDILIGMEACGGAHFLGATLIAQGHQVRLIPAQFVKPLLKSNKNDYLDAEAIAEAVQRQNVRFVPVKTGDQLDLQALHRVRDRLVSAAPASSTSCGPFYWSAALPFAGAAPTCGSECRRSWKMRSRTSPADASASGLSVAGEEESGSADRGIERRNRRCRQPGHSVPEAARCSGHRPSGRHGDGGSRRQRIGFYQRP